MGEGPLGPMVRVDDANMTTVPGVYAAGDVARQPSNAMLAAADGVRAGSAVSQSLIFGARADQRSGRSEEPRAWSPVLGVDPPGRTRR
jgi:pyruvate/2-oxoglutarate dehydrogenase complex dihydrolipoamide dehydrogenase (E3) component